MIKPHRLLCTLTGFALIVMISACSGKSFVPAAPQGGKLAPCPSTPNCVSTDSDDPEKRLPPLDYVNDRQTSHDCILSILTAMPRVTLVTVRDDYIHAEFRTRIFRFVDDVEFLFDDEKRVIHFRSAARTGKSDLGVNRTRMETISEQYRSSCDVTQPDARSQ